MKTRIVLAMLALGALPLLPASELEDANPHLQPMDAATAARYGLDPGRDGQLFRNLGVGEDHEAEAEAIRGGPFFSLALSGTELRGADASMRLQTTNEGRSCAMGSTSPFAAMPVYLPHQAQISSIRVFGFDNSATDNLTVGLVRRCTNLLGNLSTTLIAEFVSQGSPGNFTQFQSINANGEVNNQLCSYIIRVRFSSPDGANFCAGNGLRLQKVRLSWQAPPL